MSNKAKTIIAVLVAIIVLAVGYTVATAPDDRTPGQKIEDAANDLGEGIDDAARELEDRSPAEEIGDEIKDATDGNQN